MTWAILIVLIILAVLSSPDGLIGTKSWWPFTFWVVVIMIFAAYQRAA
jgi:hypothetical protein